MRTGMFGAFREVRLYMLLAAVIGSSVFAGASVSANESVFRCCTKETDCRHVDNDRVCQDTEACANDGDYKICCGEAVCTKALD